MRLALAVTLLVLAPACATFDAPPEVTIQGLDNARLADPTLPIVLEFTKKPVPSTLKLEIAPYKLDANGELPDEGDGGGSLGAFFTHDPKAGDTGGTSVLAADGMSMTITLPLALPIATELVLLVEPGLSDVAGTVTHARRRTTFEYAASLTCTMPVAVLRSGTYFFLANVTTPLPVQVQMFAVLDVDEATGVTMGRFTKGRRNPDPNRCPMPCDATHVCRLLPAPACVVPSEPAGSVDEFSDYVPNLDPMTGFSFAAHGCATDEGATTATFATEKADVAVTQPPVKLQQTQLSASFTLDDASVLRGTGSLTAEQVVLGIGAGIKEGAGSGDLTSRSLTDAEAPPGIPTP